MTLANGEISKKTVSTDSYRGAIFHPVLKAGDRKLICQSVTVDESTIQRILNPHGGGIGMFVTRKRPLASLTSLRLELDMILFEDGEICGPDVEMFARELQCRKPAAEFVAKHIAQADSEGRDATLVLEALADVPCVRGNFLPYWVRHYAADFLRHMRFGGLYAESG
jgi:hypothetical protein